MSPGPRLAKGGGTKKMFFLRSRTCTPTFTLAAITFIYVYNVPVHTIFLPAFARAYAEAWRRHCCRPDLQYGKMLLLTLTLILTLLLTLTLTLTISINPNANPNPLPVCTSGPQSAFYLREGEGVRLRVTS